MLQATHISTQLQHIITIKVFSHLRFSQDEMLRKFFNLSAQKKVSEMDKISQFSLFFCCKNSETKLIGKCKKWDQSRKLFHAKFNFKFSRFSLLVLFTYLQLAKLSYILQTYRTGLRLFLTAFYLGILPLTFQECFNSGKKEV